MQIQMQSFMVYVFLFAENVPFYIGAADGKRWQVVHNFEALADILWFHHSSHTSGHKFQEFITGQVW